MLKLTNNDITMAQVAKDKIAAIKAIAKQMNNRDLVTVEYVDGMLNRELQNSTFLGNGIAIPHGTTDTRSLVNQTGVVIHHFPNGVNWGDNNLVYVAIGIAAKSDEHLDILKQLTKVLSVDGVEEKLKAANNKEDIISLLNGDVQFEADFNQQLIQLNFPATDIIEITAVAGGLLKKQGAVDNQFVAELVVKEPTHLGNGLWLVSENKAVKRSAMAFVTTNELCNVNVKEVKGLIAIAACNQSHHAFLKALSTCIFEQQQAQLLASSPDKLIEYFTVNEHVETTTDGALSDTFKINNTHGLHARPSAMLVATAKLFNANIMVKNLDGESKSVNAKSLMKVIGLGVKYGDRLQFTVDGDDASAALKAIGEAITSGLSEG
ncbi:MAG: fused PTS fructose transporter subunit IIA/HPr protein [Psychromonas sp.]